MDKYIIFGSGEPEKTPYEYAIGETINVNSRDVYMCMSKEIIDGKIMQYFKKGQITYSF